MVGWHSWAMPPSELLCFFVFEPGQYPGLHVRAEDKNKGVGAPHLSHLSGRLGDITDSD